MTEASSYAPTTDTYAPTYGSCPSLVFNVDPDKCPADSTSLLLCNAVGLSTKDLCVTSVEICPDKPGPTDCAFQGGARRLLANADARADAGPYVRADSRTDARADAGPYVRADAGPDGRADAGPDVRADAGPDARADAGSDGRADSWTDDYASPSPNRRRRGTGDPHGRRHVALRPTGRRGDVRPHQRLGRE